MGRHLERAVVLGPVGQRTHTEESRLHVASAVFGLPTSTGKHISCEVFPRSFVTSLLSEIARRTLFTTVMFATALLC